MFKAIGRIFSGGDARPDVTLDRNDICWCGSGLKYKKCHLDKDLEKARRKAPACRSHS